MDIVARRYARALLDALPEDRAEAGLRQLLELRGLMSREPGARKLLLNPAVPAADRTAFIGRLAGALGLDEPVRRVCAMLVERRRLGILSHMAENLQSLLDERTGPVRVRVTTALPLDADRERELRERLGRSTGKTIVMEVFDDPSLIGGIVIRLGGTVMDASLRQRLRSVETQLLAE
jgi:F-type H+-transporting ATPase subunit delta